MAVFTTYIHSFMEDMLIIFSSSLQSATIAIAITGSLCASIIWLIVSLTSEVQSQQSHSKVKRHLASSSLRTMSQRNRPEFSSSVHSSKCLSLQKSLLSNVNHSSQNGAGDTLWSNRKIENNCFVPCIKCGVKSAEIPCRYVMCYECCHMNPSTVCNHHTAVALNILRRGKCSPTEMDLSHLQLVSCPNRLGFLGAQLLTLNLSNNQLHHLPPEVGCLQGLLHLYLHCNQLSSLPDSLCHLSNLQELDIQHNCFECLPSCVVHMHQLRCLRINHNLLKTIPDSVSSLINLQQIHANNNHLTSVSNELHKLSNLQGLFLGHNKLRNLPWHFGQLKRLSELDVSFNHLSFLPNSVIWCSRLALLQINDNKLVKLPERLGHLYHLKEINLRNNKLSYLPSSMLPLQFNSFLATGNPFNAESIQPDVTQMFPNSSKTPLQPKSLLEICAAEIILSGISWHEVTLPITLRGLLRNTKLCISCGQPLFKSFRHLVEYSSELGQSLPFVQFICPLHQNPSCAFK